MTLISALFINAVALGFGFFIGYMRAKEIYINYAQKQLNNNTVCKFNVKGALKVVITDRTLSELKTEYEKHKDNPEAVFSFHGERLLVSYAKYLIEFLEEGFKEVKDEQSQPTHRRNN